MITVDLLIFLGLVAFMILGFRDGFQKKVYGVIGFLVGLIAATKLMNPVGDTLVEYAGLSKQHSLIVGFCLVFLIFIIIENLIYRRFGISHTGVVKMWSRIVGGFIGLFQGAVAVSLLLILFHLFEIPSSETRKNSLLYETFYNVAPIVFDYSTSWLPESRAFFDELKIHFERIDTSH